MSKNLEIDRHLAINDVFRYYGYKAQDIHQVNGGTVGYTFSIDDKYFFKIYDKRLVITTRCTVNLLEQLTILYELQNHSLLKNKICYPFKTTENNFIYSHDNVIGVLYNFIPGSAIGFGNNYTSEEISQLSSIVKDLHSIDTSSFYDLCPIEEFELGFCDNLLLLIENDTLKLPVSFQKIVLHFRETVLEKTKEIQKLAIDIKEMKLPFVLCHTDIHGGNIIKNSNGKLFLVDWENMILAPKEADLFCFSEQEYFPAFSEQTNENAILYYVIHRDLEDIWEFLNSILHNEYNKEEQEEVLAHLKRIYNHLSLTK